MMNYRHIEELDTAVRTANQAIDRFHVQRVDELTAYLYQRWYTGTGGRGADGGAPRPQTWQAWSPHWTGATGRLGSGLVRLYLSCDVAHTARVVSLVTATAMAWEQPWRFVSVTGDDAQRQYDATILYLPIASLPQLRPEVDMLLRRLRPMLRRHVPAFTLPIGPGAALAQNPADGRSFGEHRCGLVAEAVLSSVGLLHREQVTRATRAFAAAGVDPERPYRENRAGTWDQPWRSY